MEDNAVGAFDVLKGELDEEMRSLSKKAVEADKPYLELEAALTNIQDSLYVDTLDREFVSRIEFLMDETPDPVDKLQEAYGEIMEVFYSATEEVDDLLNEKATLEEDIEGLEEAVGEIGGGDE
ncbi:MAG: hypothetical protein ACXABY_01535 [Candidatus Thorarchaeota archaeon]|jgi:predicted  nucleic acid-binding Zn-ribbon protein